MPIQVVEHFLVSKTGQQEDCEDALVMTDDFVAVIDGATSKTDKRIGGQTPGRVLALCIARTIAELPPKIAGEDAILAISSAAESSVVGKHFGRLKTREKRPSAVLAMYSVARQEVWRVGDCHYAIGEKVRIGEKKIDIASSEARSAMLEAAIVSGKTIEQLRVEDLGREFIMPLLRKQSLFMNDRSAGEWAYGVIDGTPEAAQFLEVEKVTSKSTVVLCSDGYISPAATWDLAEKERLEVVRRDPLLFREYKSTKGMMDGMRSFDDCAYVRFVCQ